MTARGCALLAALALLAGGPGACTFSRITLGAPVAPEDAAAIVQGTSKAAVLERLGPPDLALPEPGGSAFEYLYSRSAARSLDVSAFQASFSYDEARRRVDRLLVSFDARGAVRQVAIIPRADGAEPP